MLARIHVVLKAGVLDPQGRAVGRSLEALGFEGVRAVRQGKYIELDLDDVDAETARARVESMCESLLANTVVEDYTIELDA